MLEIKNGMRINRIFCPRTRVAPSPLPVIPLINMPSTGQTNGVVAKATSHCTHGVESILWSYSC